jgi:hypothetical protein
MIYTVEEFRRLTDPEASSLFYLRGCRDQLASSLSSCGASLVGDYQACFAPWAICKRIARIERVRCRCYVPEYLATA